MYESGESVSIGTFMVTSPSDSPLLPTLAGGRSHFSLLLGPSRTPEIIKSLDPLRAKKTFIRKKLGHTMVSAIKTSSVTL